MDEEGVKREFYSFQHLLSVFVRQELFYCQQICYKFMSHFNFFLLHGEHFLANLKKLSEADSCMAAPSPALENDALSSELYEDSHLRLWTGT